MKTDEAVEIIYSLMNRTKMRDGTWEGTVPMLKERYGIGDNTIWKALKILEDSKKIEIDRESKPHKYKVL